jgi:ankyrin repeat protein
VTLDVATIKGHHPMHAACASGNLELVQWLHSQGAAVQVIDSKRGVQPIHLACHGGNFELVQWLHSQGVALDVLESNGYSPQVIAKAKGHRELVKWLKQAK